MWMRFTLQERAPDGQFAKVVAPGLGVWRKSNPGVSRFAHRQKVLALGRGTAYRSIVHFRWYGEKSAPVKRRVRRSELCRQPEPLANLRVARLGGKPVAGQPGTTRYVLRIGNDGRLASPWTDVRLTVDGSTIDTVTAAPIEPGLERRIVVTGPSCSSSVGVRIDPANVVRERTKRDNSRSIDCPVP